MTDAGWLLLGIVAGVALTVLLVEWHDAHSRRQRRRRTRTGDHPDGLNWTAQQVQQRRDGDP